MSPSMRRFLVLDKRLGLLLATLSLGALVLLGIALHDFTFEPAVPLWRQGLAPAPFSMNKIFQAYEAIPAWKQFSFWLLIVVLIALISSLLSPEMRKRLFRSLISLLATLWILSYLMENRILPWTETVEGEVAPADSSDQVIGNLPPPIFSAPEIPFWQSYLLSVILIFALLVLAWSMLRWWNKLKEMQISSQPLDKLAGIARTTIHALQTGQHTGDAILRCYARMIEALEHKRGLVRQQASTPAEFACRLEQAGLPSVPVQRLTRLFEAVRYGAHKSEQNEADEAVSCLTAILHYCGEKT